MTPWQTIEYVYDDRSGLYRKLRTTEVIPFAVVWARETLTARLTTQLPCPSIRVTSGKELLAESAKPGALLFVEADLLCHVDAAVGRAPVIAIMAESPDIVPRTIRTLEAFPWLSHHLVETMLAGPTASAHLAKLVEHLVLGVARDMLGERGYGRVALLAAASQRHARFERMHAFFTERGVSGRTIDRIGEVYEELVTNALYDAPLEAGHFKNAVPRTEDVELPKDRACEISYGIDSDMAYIRVRDPFGALTRKRLLSVLSRCNASGVVLDETRGGAGLGLWRVFSVASTLAITVNPGQLTEVLVGIGTKGKRGLLAVDLAFAQAPSASRRYVSEDADLLEHSITLISAG